MQIKCSEMDKAQRYSVHKVMDRHFESFEICNDVVRVYHRSSADYRYSKIKGHIYEKFLLFDDDKFVKVEHEIVRRKL
jgi:hypothetical protein